MNREVIQNLSNVYATLHDIEVKGKYAISLAMCIKALEESIRKLNDESGGEKCHQA